MPDATMHAARARSGARPVIACRFLISTFRNFPQAGIVLPRATWHAARVCSVVGPMPGQAKIPGRADHASGIAARSFDSLGVTT